MKTVEIVVVAKSAFLRRPLSIRELSRSVNETDELQRLDEFLACVGSLRPMLSGVERRIARDTAYRSRGDVEEIVDLLEHYYVGTAPADLAPAFIERLEEDSEVDFAYWKPLVENPVRPVEDAPFTESMTASDIPDFVLQQAYLGPAPVGVDVQAAWRRRGGRGTDVCVIDIEGGWQLSHVDLSILNGGLIGGTPYQDVGWRNHGTAVLGQIGGDENALGVTGIAPEALLGAISHGGLGSAKAILLAARKLRPGDVLLLEMHRPGPRYNYQVRDDQKGYICVEWWPDDLLAIQYATEKGIFVVEAAGNGGENLDDSLYDMPGRGFPSQWRNPLKGEPLSGAILVGAGAPPSGVYGMDRSRLDFSNYGNRVDCQGWGREVVTAGYGDLFRLAGIPQDEDYWYTSRFSGTSSASPIVTGVIACLQGIAKNAGVLLTPEITRQALRSTGSPQQNNVKQRIGTRPDLSQLVEILFQAEQPILD